jgi:hypothetical protein
VSYAAESYIDVVLVAMAEPARASNGKRLRIMERGSAMPAERVRRGFEAEDYKQPRDVTGLSGQE